MLSVRQQEEENQNVAQAPILGGFGGVVTGQTAGQGKSGVSGRGSGYTNLQSYIQANRDNPNAKLIQQRTGQATQGEQAKSQAFGQTAQEAQSQLRRIQDQAGLVQSALADPTKFVQTPSNVQRITALRTGQEAIANPTDIRQNVLGASQALQSGRGELAGGLQRDITGTGLQEYLRSQRANPALATQGENRLDRFLAEQTESGINALQQAQAEADRIRRLTEPEQVSQIGQTVQDLQNNPLSTQSGILSAISQRKQDEEEALRNINNLYIASKVGIGNKISPQNLQYSEALQGIIEDVPTAYNIDPNIQATQEQLNEARTQFERNKNFRNQSLLDKEEQEVDRELRKAYSRAGNAGFDVGFALEQNNIINQLNAQKADIQNRRKNLYQVSSGRIELAPLYQNYLNQLGKSREQLLQQYDPNQLARLRALEQITGGSFQDMLGGRIV